MDKDLTNQKKPINYVEVKRVTWSKDSHGLFDYESKNVNCSKYRVENSSNCFRTGHDIMFRPLAASDSQMEEEDSNYLFSIMSDNEKKDKFHLKAPLDHEYDSTKQNLFLIVRSLKNEEGVQRGYTLELGDIIRLGRIEYRVIEYQDSQLRRYSLFDMADTTADSPFKLSIKPCVIDPNVKNQCRICLMDEHDVAEVLVNPCNCKGTSEYVHVTCLQNWINSKVKNKVTPDSACSYWKHLVCEVCKSPFPDLVDVNGEKVQVVPTTRPDQPYMLVERIFYNKSKGGDNSRMMVLLSLSNEAHQLKLGRGHECDIRENDISVSRLHAFIKYQDSKFVIIDNNSKFGTLILLRRDIEIEKRKIAVQMGRTVITFSLKQSNTPNVAIFKDPMLVEKLNGKWPASKDNQDDFDKGIDGFDMNGNLSS